MRSGTTTLTHWLRHHSQVEMAAVKEVHYFDRNYERGIGWYASQLPAASGMKTGEATPNYCYDPLAVERMGKQIPDARLLLLLRNPIDRAQSHYWHNRARGKEALSFEEAIEVEPERLERGALDRAWYSYLDRGRYLGQVDRILESFPRSSLGIFFYDDLERDPSRLFESVCRFLAVDVEDPAVDMSWKVNAYTEFHSTRMRRLGKRLPKPLGRVVGRVNVRKSVAYPEMAASTRERLRRVFGQEHEALEDVLGMAVPQWQ